MADNDKMDLEGAPASSQTARSGTSFTAGSGEGFAVGQLILHRYKILGRAPFDQTAFRAKDLKSERVVPDPNHTSTVEFRHEYGTLVVSSNRHDAEVSIEGSSTGNPPMERVLPPGRYSVLVRAPGFPDQTEVADVQIGQRMVMAFNFALPPPPAPSGEVASSGGQQTSPSTPVATPAPGNSPTASDSSTQSGSVSVASSPQSENSPQSSGSPSPSIAP